ncbi:MAG: hypothetical protein LLF97_01030 [Planctomycetaceae bacterium]|nr:hypothetical protein [Planctomycetaceae bacterium]
MERLQNIVFPNRELQDYPELFYHRHEVLKPTRNGVQSEVRLVFDSYMNAFAVRKWRTYTDIGDLYLCLRFSGRARVSIHAATLYSRHWSETRPLASHELVSQGEQFCEIRLDEPSDAMMLYFEIATTAGEKFELHDAYFGTAAPAHHDVRIAIVTCTYRRESYIQKNRERFCAFLDESPDRREAFHWYLVDNGRTLSPTIENDNIHLFPNKNTGGAGGFTRGMIEALRAEELFTHVLLMDDDLDFFTESFVRTYNLMRYVKPEHRNAFVGGSMFANNAPATIFETLSFRNGALVQKLHCQLDAKRLHHVLINDQTPRNLFETPEANMDSAWWYCCIPTDNLRSGGLPLPLFIRFDDVEYSWRHHRAHHITLNGICVWHQAFENRSAASAAINERYFAPRNMFVLNAMHIEGFGLRFPRYFFNFFKSCLAQYDYRSAEMLLVAMQDILRGPDCLREDPQKTMERLKTIPGPQSCPIAADQRPLFSEDLPPIGRKRRWLYRATFGGMLLPARFFAGDETHCASNRCDPPHFAVRQRVRVLDEATGQCTVREFQRGTIFRLTLRFFRLLWQMKRRYPSLRDQYRQAFPELTGMEFWSRYLELAPQSSRASERAEVAAGV